MATTYNVYASSSSEGTYKLIKSGLTEPKVDITADNPGAAEEKYLKVAAVNEAGEGFYSKPIKMTFIGEVPQPEILFRFNGGFFMSYEGASYSTSYSLQQSLAGGAFTDIDTSFQPRKECMAYSGQQKVAFRAKCLAENSVRTGDPTPQEVPQTFNLAGATLSSASNLYRSANGGVSWTPILGVGLIPYAACYLGDNILLLGGYGGDRRSTDGGLTWSVVTNEVFTLSYCYLGGGIVLEYTYDSIRRSTDYGQTWSPVQSLSSSGVGLDFSNYNFSALPNGGVIFGYKNGSYISTDYGQTWQGLQIGGVTAMCYIGGGTVWAGTESAGLLYNSSFGNGSWSRPFPYLNTILSICYVNGSEILVGTQDQGLWAVAGGGVDYVQRLVTDQPVRGIAHAGGGNFIAAVGNQMYQSRDNGNSWAPANLNAGSSPITFVL